MKKYWSAYIKGYCELVSWSLTSLFSTNTAISETKNVIVKIRGRQRESAVSNMDCVGWRTCVDDKPFCRQLLKLSLTSVVGRLTPSPRYRGRAVRTSIINLSSVISMNTLYDRHKAILPPLSSVAQYNSDEPRYPAFLSWFSSPSLSF